MTISYPLTLPNIGVKSFAWVPLSSVAITMSPFTYKQLVQEHKGDAWAGVLSFPFLEREEAEELRAFLLSLNGMEGTFLLGDPNGRTPRGLATGTPLCKDGGTAGTKILPIDGWTASKTGILKKGDYLQVGNRLYTALTDVNSDSNGYASIDIWPRLREAVPDNEPIVVNNCVGTFRLAQPSQRMPEANEAGIYQAAISFMEAI